MISSPTCSINIDSINQFHLYKVFHFSSKENSWVSRIDHFVFNFCRFGCKRLLIDFLAFLIIKSHYNGQISNRERQWKTFTSWSLFQSCTLWSQCRFCKGISKRCHETLVRILALYPPFSNLISKNSSFWSSSSASWFQKLCSAFWHLIFH